MYKLKKDFEFLQTIFEGFFKQKHIVNRLNEIDSQNVYGWEIWLQVEMLIYFRKLNEQISEVYREEPCLLDRRKTEKNKCAIDFVIRQKYARSFIPVEIKQCWYAPRCILQMQRDVEKYECIKVRSLPTERNMWCLGVHKAPIKQEYIEKRLEDYQFKRVCQPIKGTNYMFTLF